jgi:hypothetical protein
MGKNVAAAGGLGGQEGFEPVIMGKNRTPQKHKTHLAVGSSPDISNYRFETV